MNKKGLTLTRTTRKAREGATAREDETFVERESDMMEDNARFMELVRRKHDGGFSSRSDDDDDDDATRKRSRSRRSRKDTTGRKRRRRKKVFAAGVLMGGFPLPERLLIPALILGWRGALVSNVIVEKVTSARVEQTHTENLAFVFHIHANLGNWQDAQEQKVPLCQKEMEDDRSVGLRG